MEVLPDSVDIKITIDGLRSWDFGVAVEYQIAGSGLI